MIRPAPTVRAQRRQPRLAPPGVLHHLAAVLSLGLRQPMAAAKGSSMRRRRQRLALAQRLLDPLPAGLASEGRGSDQFWQGLRWGGLGLLVAWLLQR